MKINKIRVNSYGKLKDKEINLENGINVIYGENEAGKSTLINFIMNSFYGISKTKKGKEISDYDKYKPWQGEEFSGKIQYELDNKKEYEIYRDFNKKNPQIFDNNMVDISKEFNIDKSKGNEFFYEQTKIDEDLFLSTLAINQNEVKLEEQTQNILIQKIANLSNTGDDSVSFKRVIDRINRRQLDEIGTERSREKPINILNRKIRNLEDEKEQLEKYKNFKYEFEEKENELNVNAQKLEIENIFLKELKNLNEKETIEKEKLKIKEDILKENENKINNINDKLNTIKKENANILENHTSAREKKSYSKKINKLNLVFILLIIINIIQFMVIKNVIKYILLISIPVFLIFYFLTINKEKQKIKNKEIIEKNNLEKIKLELLNLENEKRVIEKTKNDLEEEINKIQNNYTLNINLEREKIKNKYAKEIEEEKIKKCYDLENINTEIENCQRKMNEIKLNLHSLELDKENIEPKLDSLSQIEEELINCKSNISNLQQLNSSMNLAKEVLMQSYEKMKEMVTPRFTKNLSDNIAKITNGKYNKVMVNEQDGITVELENGNYLPVNRLSIGTIDQLYLSLRLSMIDELSEESLPILLDEPFAFYDNKRLENILIHFNTEFSNRQILIFTCTKREAEILEKNNVEFNLINL